MIGQTLGRLGGLIPITCVVLCAHAAPLALPAPPAISFAPVTGAQVPLDLILRDDDGRAVRLSDLSAGKPLIIVPGYYRCPNLCSSVMDGVLESLAQAHLPHDSWLVAAVSIDSRETVAIAAAKKPAYGALLAAAGGDLHMLTAEAPTLGILMHAIGMRASRVPGSDEITHAAGFVVLTPDGRIAEAFSGVRFDAMDLRTALTQAAAGNVATPMQHLLMRCVHFDPRTGRYTVTILEGIRIAFASAFAALGAWWLWRHRTPHRSL